MCLLELFLTFAKIGLFTFGGGYAMIAIIEGICAEEKKWITHAEMMELVVIAESTPGPIAINCATYVGFRRGGVAGAVAATVGMVLPSFVIIYGISLFLDNFLEITVIANAFRGIKIGVGVLIINAGVKMLKNVSSDRLPRVILVCAFAAMLAINVISLNISTISLMVFSGIVGLAVYTVKRGAGK